MHNENHGFWNKHVNKKEDAGYVGNYLKKGLVKPLPLLLPIRQDHPRLFHR